MLAFSGFHSSVRLCGCRPTSISVCKVPLCPKRQIVPEPSAGLLSPPVVRVGYRSKPTRVGVVGQGGLTPEEYAETTQMRLASGGLSSVSYVSFWLQLALTLVSGSILFFSVAATAQGSTADPAKWCTLVGVVLGFISTFFAHGIGRLAKKLQADEYVSKNWLVGSMLRSNALNLFGIGAAVIGLQASVGTLVGKTLMTSSQFGYGAPPGGAVLSLDIFALQALTNTLMAHFVAIMFTNIMLGMVNKNAKTAKAY